MEIRDYRKLARLAVIQDATHREIAEAIGRNLNLPVKSIAAEDAAEHFTFLGGFISLDGPISSTHTRELMDWRPAHAGLIEDIDAGHYFAEQGEQPA